MGRIRLFVMVCLFFSIGLPGCVNNPSKTLLNDQRLVVHSSLNRGISFEQIIDRLNNAGFTEVQLSGYNASSSIRKVEYRITWFDEQGMAIKTILSRWNKTTLVNKNPFYIHFVSPQNNISSYVIQIQEEGSVGFEQAPNTY